MFVSVDPKEITTVLLNDAYIGFNVTSARNAITMLIKQKKHVRAIGVTGEPVDWERWINDNTLYFSNHPCLHSAHNVFAVPTIISTSSDWSFKSKKKVSLRYLYNRYRGRCQICGRKFGIKSMSIEHVKPTSKGGDNDIYNFSLTCKRCNSLKSSTFPVKNYKGSELKGTNPLAFFETQIKREEWRPYLFKEE